MSNYLSFFRYYLIAGLVWLLTHNAAVDRIYLHLIVFVLHKAYAIWVMLNDKHLKTNK